MPKEFEIAINWMESATVKIKADSLEEAIEEAKELCEPPTQGDFMDSTITVAGYFEGEHFKHLDEMNNLRTHSP